MKNSVSEWHVASIMPPVDETVNGKYRYQGWLPCIKWCTETFGHHRMNGWRFVGEGVFEFYREEDLTLFLLRWG